MTQLEKLRLYKRALALLDRADAILKEARKAHQDKGLKKAA